MIDETSCPDIVPHGLVGVMAALSDPMRLAIVTTLVRGGECAWGGFDLPISKSTLSHHFKVLREAGIIQHRKDGLRCWISLRGAIEEDYPGLIAIVTGLAAADPQVDLLVKASMEAA